MQKKCKSKRVGALRGGWRVDCEKKVQNEEGWGIKGWITKKKCKIKRVWVLRVGLQKKCQIKKVGTLWGRWRVDCEKVQN